MRTLPGPPHHRPRHAAGPDQACRMTADPLVCCILALISPGPSGSLSPLFKLIRLRAGHSDRASALTVPTGSAGMPTEAETGAAQASSAKISSCDRHPRRERHTPAVTAATANGGPRRGPPTLIIVKHSLPAGITPVVCCFQVVREPNPRSGHPPGSVRRQAREPAASAGATIA